jgi:hypothetical protein
MANKKSQACSNSSSVDKNHSRCHAWAALLSVNLLGIRFNNLMKSSAYPGHCSP